MCQSDLDLSPDQYMTVVDAMLIRQAVTSKSPGHVDDA